MIVRSTDTTPEILLQELLTARDLDFEKHPNDLPGTPDIVLRDDRVAIFVHGCFWHRHAECGRDKLPLQNTMQWLKRFRRTAQRHEDVSGWLNDDGWRVLTVWECHLHESLEETALALGAFIPSLVVTLDP